MKFKVKCLHVFLLSFGIINGAYADQIKNDIYNCNQQVKKGNLDKALEISI